jgi:predicted nucleotidyltransferase
MTKERQIIEKIKCALERVREDLVGYRVFLFGSRAAGTAGERSDFDIGIMGASQLPLRVFYRIDDLLNEIETLYSIDLVDMHEVSDSFRQEALRKTEVIFG